MIAINFHLKCILLQTGKGSSTLWAGMLRQGDWSEVLLPNPQIKVDLDMYRNCCDNQTSHSMMTVNSCLIIYAGLLTQYFVTDQMLINVNSSLVPRLPLSFSHFFRVRILHTKK